MKNVLRKIWVLILLLVVSCDSEDANDCLKVAGEIVSEERNVDDFNRILFNQGVKLYISQSEEVNVRVESGKNLIGSVTTKVVEGQLVISQENTCNRFRDYGLTKVYVSVPDLTEIRNSSQYEVRSEGVLNFNKLTLLAENYNKPQFLTNGNFYLDLNVNSLNLVFNGLSNAYLSGNAGSVSINFAAGNSRFEGRGLEADHINIYHRGSNDMILNPQSSVKGNIYGTGNVICVNKPEVVEVEAHYKGKLIFE